MIKQKKIEPLVSEELIRKVKELGTLSKQEKAKACGYYSITKNGIERVNMKQFLNALINAEGINLDGNGKADEHEEPSVNPVTTQPSQIKDSNNVITVIRTNKPTTKPLLLSQPVQQLEIKSVQEPEAEQLEQPESERYMDSLIEPLRDESVYGSGWSVTELMNEFSGR